MNLVLGGGRPSLRCCENSFKHVFIIFKGFGGQLSLLLVPPPSWPSWVPWKQRKNCSMALFMDLSLGPYNMVLNTPLKRRIRALSRARTSKINCSMRQCEGLTGSPRKSQKKGQEDQGMEKVLRDPPGCVLPSGSSLSSLSTHFAALC